VKHKQSSNNRIESKSARRRESGTPEKLEQLLPELLGVPREQIPAVQRALKQRAAVPDRPRKTRR
jgi:hypothetical protein